MSELDSVTLPEVTIVDDAGSAPDPASADDAYADGYSAAVRGAQYDPSAYNPEAVVGYDKGWSIGAAEAQLAGSDDEHSGTSMVAEGVAELLIPEVMNHLLHSAPWATLVALATSPGGDTPLRQGDVYLPTCHRTDHRLSGDAMFDAGTWHGNATLAYADAAAETAEHASIWEHPDGAHIWSNHDGDWAQLSSG